MVKVFHDADADLEVLAGQTVAVIGYGIQGRAQAHNLRDSGISVIVGNRPDACRERAAAEGFATFDIAGAAERGDILLLLIPDEVQPDVYRGDLLPHLRNGNALVFAHGFAIRYGLIDPPAGIDVLLVSPRMPGSYVRERFVAGSGLIIGAIEEGYRTLVRNGYTPEAALMELYGSGEVGEVLRTAADIGMYNMLDRNASPACQYGIYTHKDRLITEGGREQMQAIIDRIKSGEFASELIADQQNGHRRLRELADEAHRSDLVPVEAAVRELMKVNG